MMTAIQCRPVLFCRHAILLGLSCESYAPELRLKMNEKSGNPFGFCHKFQRFELCACSCGFASGRARAFDECELSFVSSQVVTRRQRFALPRRRDRQDDLDNCTCVLWKAVECKPNACT